MPVSIHGKEYYTVVERMNMLIKKHENNYSIDTELVQFEGGCVIMKATLKIGSQTYCGHAMEEVGSSKINTTSALENCETSAIGRCLSSAGFFGSEFCSANELQTALTQQKQSKPTSKPNKEVVDMMHNAVNPPTLKAVKDKFGDDNVNLVKNLITFGKHNGQEWNKIPEDYIVWVAKNSKVEYQREQAEKELQRRNPKPKRQSGGMSEKAYQEDLEGMPV